MMRYSLFPKILPRGPDVACWLISHRGDCLSSLHLPSFAWKPWPSASRPWKELTSVSCISPLYSGPQPSAEWNPGDGQPTLSRSPTLQRDAGCGQREAGGRCPGASPSSSMAPELALSSLGESGLVDPFLHNVLIALSALPFPQGCRLVRSSLRSPQPLSGGGRPVMGTMRTSLQNLHPPGALGFAPLSSVSPRSWLSPSLSILEDGPRR